MTSVNYSDIIASDIVSLQFSILFSGSAMRPMEKLLSVSLIVAVILCFLSSPSVSWIIYIFFKLFFYDTKALVA